jgi:MFS family permease
MKNEKTGKSNRSFWLLLWGLGLAGQICWNIENQWFNTFIYAKIAKDSTIVTIMVITSALVATFSTFLFGTLSDRLGKRKKFISIGYICWGITTILFGLTEFISGGQVGTGSKMSVLAAVLVILADDVMSFFGSMGNDSGYSAWSNDMTHDKNRGQVGAVLAVLPVIGTVLGTIVGGMLIGSDDNYQMLFWVMGLFVIASGVLSLIFLKDAPHVTPHKEGSFWQQFSQVFRFKDMLKQRELLMACLTSTVFFIAFNIYFTHMGNWLIYRMGFDASSMGLIEGIGLLLASLLVIPGIKLINNNKTPLLAAISIVLNFVGVVYIFFTVHPNTVNPAKLFSLPNLPLFIGVFLAGAGYILITQSLTMWVKELYPEEAKGQFEGIRIAFFALLPMFGGTILANIIVKNGSGTFVNDYGITENIPTESIYGWAAVIVLFAFIPLFIGAKDYWKRKKAHSE